MAYMLIPKRPPDWIERSCEDFAASCRRNNCRKHIELSIGSGNIDTVTIDGKTYVLENGGAWFEAVKVDG